MLTFQRKKIWGLTLVELLVSLVIIGILVSIASVLYTSHIKRARRTDAIQALLSIQLAEENYRTDNPTYGTLAQVWNGVTTTSGGYYTLSISNISATSYTVTAQALSAQASDAENGTSCGSLVVAMSNGTETKTPTGCWLKG
jgi:type IV pilus assembly protein PilE